MGNELQFNLEKSGDQTHLVVTGEITEDADFGPVLQNDLGALLIDLSQVKRINSCGVREWIEFMRACEDANVPVTLENCAPFIVAQLNMISNFAGKNGAVRSVFAPYYCDACGNEHSELIDLSAGDIPELEEEISCPKCGETAEFDDIPETYLQFMIDG